MGADLHISKDEKEETGYFRDSYNESNIFWRLGLSYWSLDKQIPIGKISSRLTLKQVKILKTEIEKRKPIMEKFFVEELSEEWLKSHNCDSGVKGWQTYWTEKYDNMLKFLNHAIELKSSIRWSV
jgi:hypothetical protein